MRKSVSKILKKLSGGNREVYKELKRLKRINAIKLKQIGKKNA